MADGRDPPPTQKNDNEYLHKRAQDAKIHTHTRWYDGTKVHVAIIATILGLLGGSVALGYMARDFTRTVETSPMRWQEAAEINQEQWDAIGENTQAVNIMGRQTEFMLSVLAEMHCALNAETDGARRRCQSSETERRLQRWRQQ